MQTEFVLLRMDLATAGASDEELQASPEPIESGTNPQPGEPGYPAEKPNSTKSRLRSPDGLIKNCQAKNPKASILLEPQAQNVLKP